MNKNTWKNIFLLISIIVIILLLFFQEKNDENFTVTQTLGDASKNIGSYGTALNAVSYEALQNLASMYYSGNVTGENINLTGNKIISKNPLEISNISSSGILSSRIDTSNICFDANNCMDITLFKKIKNLNSYIYVLGQSMYLSDGSNCIIYHDIFNAKNNNIVAPSVGMANYDDKKFSTTLWGGLKLIQFGKGKESTDGMIVKLPKTESNKSIVWIRVPNDRHVSISASVKKNNNTFNIGNFATGFKRLNRYSPDGASAPYSYTSHVWMPIPLPRSITADDEILIKSRDGTGAGLSTADNIFYVSGIAFTSNPWNHVTNSAVAYRWNINRESNDTNEALAEWYSDNWNNDVLWICKDGVIPINVLCIDSSRDKLLYFIIHNDSWDGTGYLSLKVNGIELERLTTTYTNPFATHHNSVPYSRYIAAKIPYSIIANYKPKSTTTTRPDHTLIVLPVTLDMTNTNAGLHIREIGTHDFCPYD